LSQIKLNRLAVSFFFFANGFAYANWVARIPEVQSLYGFDNSTLGAALLFSAFGAIAAMPFTGWLTVRFGSKQLTTWAGIGFALLVPLLPLLPNFALLAGLFFLIGVATGALDVAMNAQAVLVERRWQKPIMSSFHAIFSVGTAMGAGTGALFAKWKITLFAHFCTVTGLILLSLLWAMTHLLTDAPTVASGEPQPSVKLPTKAILPLGLIAFCAMVGEGSMADWSALYVNKIVGESESTAALAFGAFATAMTMGRFFGDYFVARYGIATMLIVNSLISFFGLTLLIAVPLTWVVMAGFFLVGLGLSSVVPIVYSAAGNRSDVSPSVGIAMATTIGYAGFFVGPPSIGYMADAFTLRWALLFPLALLVLMLVLSFGQKTKKA
jgi:MFS family permease